MIEQITTEPTKIRAGESFKIKVKVTEYNTDTSQGEDLTLVNSKENGKTKFTFKGNTFQQTYQGKNLIDWSTPDSTTSNTTYTFANDILTVSNSSGSSKRAQWDITNLWKQHADRKSVV